MLLTSSHIPENNVLLITGILLTRVIFQAIYIYFQHPSLPHPSESVIRHFWNLRITFSLETIPQASGTQSYIWDSRVFLIPLLVVCWWSLTYSQPLTYFVTFKKLKQQTNKNPRGPQLAESIELAESIMPAESIVPATLDLGLWVQVLCWV